jgi:hypothetical protein
MSAFGPTLPIWALRQAGSYLEYTGPDANVAAKAARDPYRKSASFGLDVGRLDDWPPFLDFRLLKRAERFRRLLVAWKNLQSKFCKP